MNDTRIRTFIITLTLTASLAAPLSAYAAYPKAVEKWRPVVRLELRRQHVWSRPIEDRIVHIIDGESTGRERAGSPRGCYGLLQFDRGWLRTTVPRCYRKGDWRGNGRASIWVIVRLYAKHGTGPLKRHWRATYY